MLLLLLRSDAATQVSGTDTAAATDALGALGAALAASEPGMGADAATLQAAVSATEAGSGADVASLAAAASVADTAAGSDASSGIALVGPTETGLGADASSLAAATTRPETGAGSETSSLSAAIGGLETGLGTEASAVEVRPPGEVAGGSDASSLAASHTRPDTGAGSEASTLAASHTRPDTGAGSEASIVGVFGTDTAAAGDTSSLAAAVTRSDTGTGTEGRPRITGDVSFRALEIDIYDGANPSLMLATLQNARRKAVLLALNDTGSGQFSIHASDPKATPTNIRRGNLVRVRVNGTYRHAFFAEEPVYEGAYDGTWTVAGRGIASYLERGRVYPTGWPTPGTDNEVRFSGRTAGYIFDALLAAAKARGAIPLVTWDFTAAVDSAGVAWGATFGPAFRAGSTLLDVFRQMASLGVDVEMTPDFVVRMWVARGVHREDQVILREGRHFGAEVRRGTRDSELRTRMLVEGEGGKWAEVVDAALEADPLIGRREGYLSFEIATDTATLQAAGNTMLAKSRDGLDTLSLDVLAGSGPGEYDAFAHYSYGDWIRVDAPTKAIDRVVYRIAALTLTETEEGSYDVNLDLGRQAIDPLLEAARQRAGGPPPAGELRTANGNVIANAGGLSVVGGAVMVTSPTGTVIIDGSSNIFKIWLSASHSMPGANGSAATPKEDDDYITHAATGLGACAFDGYVGGASTRRKIPLHDFDWNGGYLRQLTMESFGQNGGADTVVHFYYHTVVNDSTLTWSIRYFLFKESAL